MRMYDFQPHTNALPPSPAAARGEGEGARQAPRGGGGARPRTQGTRIDRPRGGGGGHCPRGKIQANVMSRFGSARDEVRVTAAGPPRDVRNAVAHRPKQKRASGSKHSSRTPSAKAQPSAQPALRETAQATTGTSRTFSCPYCSAKACPPSAWGSSATASALDAARGCEDNN